MRPRLAREPRTPLAAMGFRERGEGDKAGKEEETNKFSSSYYYTVSAITSPEPDAAALADADNIYRL